MQVLVYFILFIISSWAAFSSSIAIAFRKDPNFMYELWDRMVPRFVEFFSLFSYRGLRIFMVVSSMLTIMFLFLLAHSL